MLWAKGMKIGNVWFDRLNWVIGRSSTTMLHYYINIIPCKSNQKHFLPWPLWGCTLVKYIAMARDKWNIFFMMDCLIFKIFMFAFFIYLSSAFILLSLFFNNLFFFRLLREKPAINIHLWLFPSSFFFSIIKLLQRG